MKPNHLLWPAIALAGLLFGWGIGRLIQSDSSVTADQGSSDRFSGPSYSSLSEMKQATGFSSLRHIRTGQLKMEKPTLTEEEIEKLGTQFRYALSQEERRMAFHDLLKGLTADNALEVRKWVEHLHPNNEEYRLFHYAWGQVAGKDAIYQVLGQENVHVSSIAAGWASTDPHAAKNWINNLDVSEDSAFQSLRDRGFEDHQIEYALTRSTAWGMSDADPDMAAAFVFERAMAGDERIAYVMDNIAEKIIDSAGLEVARQWAENIPYDRATGNTKRLGRDQAMDEVAKAFARLNAEEAIAWAYSLTPGDQEHALGGIAEVWGRKNGPEAVQWAFSISEKNPGKSEAIEDAFEGWARNDARGLSEYLTQNTNFESRDTAIRELVQRERWNNPEAALAWANDASTAEERQELVVIAGAAYFRKNPDEAREWMANSGVSEEVQKKIRRQAKRWR
jgi:hypothetical protein